VFSTLRTLTLSLLALSLLTTGCIKGSTSPAPEAPSFAVTCVGVLPAVAATNYDKTPTVAAAEEAKETENGLFFLDELLKKYFGNRSDIRLVSDGQISGMDKNLPAQPLERARVIADRLSCNAVLETTLNRFKDRVGGQYTADEPASVSFSYRLIAIPDGTVICRGAFDETQQSVMENLFSIRTGADNAFSWLTAQQLMEQGLAERLQDCSYLAKD
jgi:hypothetical protein